MRDRIERFSEAEIMDYVWELMTQLQAMTDRLWLQYEKTERLCFVTPPVSDAYSLSSLHG